MRLLASQNQYPDCLTLELVAIPLSAAGTNPEQFELSVTLNFGEQWFPLLDGRVRFGLKGGELRLERENATMSSIERDLGEYFQLTATASKTNPIWVVAIKTNATLLKGAFSGIKLGTAQVTAQPYRLRASFSVSPPEVTLTASEELWRHDISPNKHGILERKLVQFLCQTKFPPYLSWVQLGSQTAESGQNGGKPGEEDSNLSQEEQLKALIQQIYSTPTDDFLELANLAGLDPLGDLAGGNFLAAELSGVSLSGANLCRTNLRGANLTDADLSEANLTQAKLSGADLSGAYLGNANLRDADLHRASLALANLIGADLSGANFEEVNLSQANFSGAAVAQARFGNNPGLSETMKQMLETGGAIFI